MCPYLGDYTEQQKKEKGIFSYHACTPRSLKGATLFKIGNVFSTPLDETHRFLGLLES